MHFTCCSFLRLYCIPCGHRHPCAKCMFLYGSQLIMSAATEASSSPTSDSPSLIDIFIISLSSHNWQEDIKLISLNKSGILGLTKLDHMGPGFQNQPRKKSLLTACR